MIAKLCIAVCWLAVLRAEDKWVWGNNRGRDGLRGEHSIARPVINGNYATSASAPLFSAANKRKNNPQAPQSDDPGEDPRYEVYEGGNGPANANELPGRPPIRPPTQYPGPGRPPLGPTGGPPQFPSRPPGPGGPGPLGNRPPPPLPPPGPGPQGGQGNPDLGVLTGPVPSWERPQPHKNNDPTSFDSCKCVNSFNCKSPGLKFGTCDVGKNYCCYNNPGFGVYPSGAPSFGAKGEDGPPILAGPNGPVDQLRPDFLRPPGGPFGPNEALFNRRPPPPPGPGFGPLPFDDTIVPRSNRPTNRKISRS